MKHVKFFLKQFVSNVSSYVKHICFIYVKHLKLEKYRKTVIFFLSFLLSVCECRTMRFRASPHSGAERPTGVSARTSERSREVAKGQRPCAGTEGEDTSPDPLRGLPHHLGRANVRSEHARPEGGEPCKTMSSKPCFWRATNLPFMRL